LGDSFSLSVIATARAEVSSSIIARAEAYPCHRERRSRAAIQRRRRKKTWTAASAYGLLAVTAREWTAASACGLLAVTPDPVIASDAVAWRSSATGAKGHGLPRRYAPRSDGKGVDCHVGLRPPRSDGKRVDCHVGLRPPRSDPRSCHRERRSRVAIQRRRRKRTWTAASAYGLLAVTARAWDAASLRSSSCTVPAPPHDNPPPDNPTTR
jgi:hypothetical protein